MQRRRRGKKPRRNACASPARSLRFEQLEDRRLLAAAITVNSIADSDTRDAFLTLREAILVNNRTLAVGSLTAQEQAQIVGAPTAVDADTIRFNIAGAGPHTISPTSALPNITDPVLIDGYTQPGATANTGTPQQALNTVLKIELAGNLTPASAGLRLAAGSGGSTIRGLAINRFANNLWIDTHGNTIAGNFIGTNITGTAAMTGGNNGVLLISAANNTIGGTNPADSNLISGNGTNGITIVETGANNNVIRGNRIGTDITGTIDVGNTIFGVYLYRAQGTIIGGNTAAARNLISGNNNSGIWMDENSHDAVIQGNLIGTNLAGTGKIANGNLGINTNFTARTIIGGLGVGEGNIIAGNGGSAIMIQNGVAPVIQGNRIGTDASGTLNLGNAGGVFLSSVRDSTIKSNTIAFNGSGISVSGNTFGDVETGNLISQNSIYSNTSAVAIDLFGTTGVVNGPDFPQDATDNDTGANNLQNFPIITSVTDLGGMTRVQGTLTSLLNSTFRLEFFASAMPTSSGFGPGQTFLGDFDVVIGGGGNTVNFMVDLPAIPSGQPLITATATDITNPGSGPRNNTSEFSPAVAIDTAYRVTTTSDQTGATLRQALVAANFSPGINTITFAIPANDPNHFYYQNDGIAGQVSRANIATTTAANDASIANIDPDWAHSWYSIELGSKLVITDEVIIDGYTQPGAVVNTNAAGQGLNSVLKIEINGENATGIVSLDGLIHVDTGDSTLRGLVINRAGVLETSGMHIQLRSGTNNKIEGNYIGTDVSGTYSYQLGFNTFEPVFAAIGVNHNPGSPISGNVIGGTAPAARNLLSGASAGVAFFDTAPNNIVQGNLIGTDRSATRAIGNFVGVWAETVGTLIGGAVAGAGNVISGNGSGVSLQDFAGNGHHSIVQNNWIGTNATGTAQLGNVTGIGIAADNNEIRGNRIAFNGTAMQGGGGITVGNNSTGNLITQNSIHSNYAGGIELLGQIGHDPNDVPPGSNPPDQDTGGNGLQNHPVLTSAIAAGGGTQVQGSLTSTPNSSFRIEFFANDERDPRESFSFLGRPFEYGEGKTYLGFVNVATNASGIANFSTTVSAVPPNEEFVTAVAIDITNTGLGPRNNSSEFSAVYPIGGPSTVVTKTGDLGVGTLREAMMVLVLSGAPGSVTFNIPANDPRHFYYQNDGVAGRVTRANIATTAQANDASIVGIDPDWAHSWYSILPLKELPEIGEQVVIDGYTQSGSSRNTLAAPGGLNTVIKIEVDGSNVGGDGLSIGTDGALSLIEGLAINRFGGDGIHLETISTVGGQRIYGNFIGTDVSGTIDLGNLGNGIWTNDKLSRLGGAAPAMRNLISGNTGFAILQGDWGSQIQGNVIGMDRTASKFLANSAGGILLDSEAFSITVGGTGAGMGNVIATDGEAAIMVIDSSYPFLGLPESTLLALEPYRETVQDAYESRDLFFATNSQEHALAALISVFNLLIIADNEGLNDLYSQANVFSGNQILVREDAGPAIGIDLAGNGITANDNLDADGGPNNLRNFPVVSSAVTSGGTTTVTGTLHSVPNTMFRIELFASEELLSTGHGPGETFMGFIEVTTNGSGNASFNVVLPAPVPLGRFITATATYLLDLDENPGTAPIDVETSEFSLGKLVTSGTPVLGDYNGNGIVDAADYTIWRDTRGSTTDLRANGDSSNSIIDTGDLQVWRSRFGSLLGAGSGAATDESLGSEIITEALSAHLASKIQSAQRAGGGGNFANRATIGSGESNNRHDLLLLAFSELGEDNENSNRSSPIERSVDEPKATPLALDLALADWTAL